MTRYLAVAALAFGLTAGAHVSSASAQSAPSPSSTASPSSTTSAIPGTVRPAQSAPTASTSAMPSASAMPSPSAAPATPAPPPKTIQFSGYAAAAYEHFGTSSNLGYRVFDTHPEAFNLQAVNIKTVITLPAGLGITAESVFGTDADGLASNGTSKTDGFDLPQAYVSYNKGGFTLIAGRFASLAGAEVFQDPTDYEFSRSFLYGYAEPFTHTGVRATYAFDGGKYTLNAGANNGWDDIKFVGKKKTFEFGPTIVISPAFTLAASTYNGQDFTNNYAGGAIRNNGDVGERALYDFVLTSKATPSLTFVSNYDNGNQQNVLQRDTQGATILDQNASPLLGSGHFTGFSQIADYQYNAKFGLALRGEVFHDGAGSRLSGPDQFLREGTATIAYTPSTPLLFRVEYRVDGSNQNTFATTQGGFVKHQNSVAVETAVKF